MTQVNKSLDKHGSTGATRIQKILKSDLVSKFRIAEALFALGIVNTTYFIGLILLNFNGFPFFLPFIDLSLSGLQFDLMYLFLYWIFVFHPIMFSSFVLGWIFAGIWAKRNHGDAYTQILITAALLPVIFTFTITTIAFLILTIHNPLAFLSILISLVQFFVIFMVLALCFSLVGLITGKLVSTNSKTDFYIDQDPVFLTLNVSPPTPGETIEYCPFRMKGEKAGCAFLGYEAPDKPLICDYKSTYRRCTVYAHLYESVMEGNE